VLLPRRSSIFEYLRIHTHANIRRHVICTCKLVFRQARFAAFIRSIQYTFHLLIRTGEDRVFPHREFELKPIDRRQDTNLGAPPIIYEPRHLSRHKPRDGGRIPCCVRLCKISMCKRNFQVRFTRLSREFRFSVTERIFRRCTIRL